MNKIIHIDLESTDPEDYTKFLTQTKEEISKTFGVSPEAFTKLEMRESLDKSRKEFEDFWWSQRDKLF